MTHEFHSCHVIHAMVDSTRWLSLLCFGAWWSYYGVWQSHLVFAFDSPIDIQIGSDKFDNNDKLENGLDNLSRGHNLQ